MFKVLINDIFSRYSSFEDRCFAALMSLLMVAAVALFGWFIFILINSAAITPSKTTITVIETKQIVPAYTTITYITTGQVMIPIINSYPESYILHFKINGKDVSFTVKKDFFVRVHTGERIEVEYGFGRLNGSHEPVRIKSVYDEYSSPPGK